MQLNLTFYLKENCCHQYDLILHSLDLIIVWPSTSCLVWLIDWFLEIRSNLFVRNLFLWNGAFWEEKDFSIIWKWCLNKHIVLSRYYGTRVLYVTFLKHLSTFEKEKEIFHVLYVTFLQIFEHTWNEKENLFTLLILRFDFKFWFRVLICIFRFILKSEICSILKSEICSVLKPEIYFTVSNLFGKLFISAKGRKIWFYYLENLFI